MTKTQSSPFDFRQNITLVTYDSTHHSTSSSADTLNDPNLHTHQSSHVSASRHLVRLDDNVQIRRWRCSSCPMSPMSASCLPHITACSPLLLATKPPDCYCLSPLHTGPHALAAQRWSARDFYRRTSSTSVYLVAPVKAIPCSRSTHQCARARSSKVLDRKYVITRNHICHHQAPKKEQAASP